MLGMFGRILLLTLLLICCFPITAFAQEEEEPGFFTSVLERLGIGGNNEEGIPDEPLIDPAYIPPFVAGIALGIAGILIYLGYQPPPPKRDPFNRRQL